MNTEDMTDERLLVTLEMSGWIERSTIAKTVELLIEVERRKLDLELSYTSMFDFCIRRLRFTENEAYRRLTCARLVAKHPCILPPLRDGKVTLTNIVLLRDLFTAENVDELLAEIADKTRREVEAVVARLQPKPDVPDSIQLVPIQPALIVADPGAATSPVSTPSQPGLAKPTPAARPLSEDRYAFSFTGDAALLEKIEKARGLVHDPRDHSLANLLGLALDAFIAQREKVKLGKTSRPRKAKPSKDPSYITAKTRREVATRDEMQCTFTSAEGMRCPSREQLELDHRQPRARGGSGDASNVRILCKRHNRHEAEKAFGREHIERSINTAQAKRRSTAAVVAPASDVPLPPVAEAVVSSPASDSDEEPGNSTPLSLNYGTLVVSLASETATKTSTATTAEPRGSADDDAKEDDAKKRGALRFALVNDQGFKSTDVDRLLAAMTADRATWSRPLGSLFVEALRRLCAKPLPPVHGR